MIPSENRTEGNSTGILLDVLSVGKGCTCKCAARAFGLYFLRALLGPNEGEKKQLKRLV